MAQKGWLYRWDQLIAIVILIKFYSLLLACREELKVPLDFCTVWDSQWKYLEFSPEQLITFQLLDLVSTGSYFPSDAAKSRNFSQLTFQLSSYPAIYHPNNSIQRQSTVSLLNVAIKNLHWHNFHFWVYHLQTHWKVHILIPVFGGAYILIQGCIYPDTFVQGCIYPDIRVHISWFLIYVFGGAYILIQRCIYPDTCVQGWNYPLHTE